MNHNQQIIDAALIFAAKFGFVTREVFFSHLCPRSRSRKYVNWNELKQTGLFKESKGSKDVLFLTAKGAVKSGIRAVRPRFASYIPHDSEVARFLFALQSLGLVRQTWTESQLKESPWDALTLMGSKNLDKLPDAIADLKANSGDVRIALEMECNRKSKERYEQIALAYIGAKKIDLIVFVGNRASDLEVIRRAFASAGLSPALVQINDFKKCGLHAEAIIKNRRLVFSDLLGKLLNVSRDSIRDERETVVSRTEVAAVNQNEKIA